MNLVLILMEGEVSWLQTDEPGGNVPCITYQWRGQNWNAVLKLCNERPSSPTWGGYGGVNGVAERKETPAITKVPVPPLLIGTNNFFIWIFSRNLGRLHVSPNPEDEWD